MANSSEKSAPSVAFASVARRRRAFASPASQTEENVAMVSPAAGFAAAM